MGYTLSFFALSFILLNTIDVVFGAECGDFEKSLCKNGATCAAGDDGKMSGCNCMPGYSGPLCENIINECDSNPCQNEGNCTDLIGKYECNCIEGYSGDNCQMDRCTQEKIVCHNGGRCELGVCQCGLSYTGKNCESKALSSAEFKETPNNMTEFERELATIVKCSLTKIHGNVRVVWMFENSILGMFNPNFQEKKIETMAELPDDYSLDNAVISNPGQISFDIRIEPALKKHTGWYKCKICFDSCMGKATNLVKKAYIDIKGCAKECKGCTEKKENCKECADGYKLGKGGCVDINECDKNPCKDNTKPCENKDGSYECPCKEGFRKSRQLKDSCEDFPCQEDSQCEKNMKCKEKKCVCPDPMQRKNGKCLTPEKKCDPKCGGNEKCEKGICNCNAGFEREETDKGECLEKKEHTSDGVSAASLLFYLLIVVILLAIPCYLLYAYYDKISEYFAPEVQNIRNKLTREKTKDDRPKNPKDKGYGKLKNVEEALGSETEEFSRPRKTIQQIY